MKTLLIACQMCEAEVRQAIEKTGVDYQTVWLEPALHNVPANLRKQLQEIFDTTDAERVILFLGSCGNGTMDLQVQNFELVFPRVDDCVSLLIGSVDRRMELTQEHHCFFMTDGWLKSADNVWNQYLKMKDEFGEETAQMLYSDMYANYRSIALMDTGFSPYETLVEHVRPVCEQLCLSTFRLPVTTEYLEQVITGPWTEDRFIVKPPHSSVTFDDMITCQGSDTPSFL